jgi:hypothetical protein
MSQFSTLLQQAAAEVREYCRTSPDAATFGIESLLWLARRMEVASALESDADVEREIDALAYLIVDSGPLTVSLAPSFTRALNALQRRREQQPRT